MSPTCVGIYPPLSPGAFLRRPAAQLPFPLEEPNCRLYMEARQGLWSGLKGLGIGSGDGVLAPAYHHGSEIEAIRRTGADCRFYDCPDGVDPDEKQLQVLLGPRVRALYVIHYLGFAQDSLRWRRWCDERGLLLIEDGAQAWLGAQDGRPLGSAADLALFCLYKAFGFPDGGAVISSSFARAPPDDDSVGARALAGRAADWVIQRSRVGSRLLRNRRHPVGRAERPDVDFALTATEERATRATRSLLSRVVEVDAPARRRANFARLAERLEGLRSPRFGELPPGSSPLAFPIEVDDKEAVVDRLAREGIMETRMWTVPHPAVGVAAFPGAAALRARLVGLPVHQELRARDIERIGAAAAKLCRPG